MASKRHVQLHHQALEPSPPVLSGRGSPAPFSGVRRFLVFPFLLSKVGFSYGFPGRVFPRVSRPSGVRGSPLFLSKKGGLGRLRALPLWGFPCPGAWRVPLPLSSSMCPPCADHHALFSVLSWGDFRVTGCSSCSQRHGAENSYSQKETYLRFPTETRPPK